VTAPEAQSAPARHPLPLQFLRVVVREVAFKTLERDGPEVPLPPQVPVKLEVNLSIYMSQDGRQSEVRYDVTLTPDPRWRPYVVRVVLSGFFATPEEGRVADLGDFSQRAAPNILWPFVRDYVYRITGDGLHGPLLLDPAYVGQMIAPAQGPGVVVGLATSEPIAPKAEPVPRP
jgi:preprotein translocase subunit SecB